MASPRPKLRESHFGTMGSLQKESKLYTKKFHSPTRTKYLSPIVKKKSEEAICDESDELYSNSEEEYDEADKIEKIYSPISSSSPRSDVSSPRSRYNLSSSGEESFGSRSLGSHHKGTRFDERIELEKKRSPRKHVYPDLESEFKEKKPSFGFSPIILIFSVLLLMLSLLIYLRYFHMVSQSAHVIKSPDEIFAAIKSDLKSIARDFHQPSQLWSQVLGQVKDVTDNEPLQPSVLLLVVPIGAERTGSCLVHQIAQAVSKGFGDSGHVVFDIRSNLKLDVDDLKHQIEETLHHLSYLHCAVIHNLESIQPKAALLFHAFCDNENAHHKQALILFTLSAADLHYNSNGMSELDYYIEGKFRELWSTDLRDVDIAAIVARIASAPILVKPESTKVLEKYCSL